MSGLRVDANHEDRVTPALPHTRATVVAVIAAPRARDRGARSSCVRAAPRSRPGEGRRQLREERQHAGRTFITNSYKALKKCVDTIFACVQLKPDDPDCLPEGADTCDKQFLALDTRRSSSSSPSTSAAPRSSIPFATLRTALAANIDSLANDCRPYGVVRVSSLDDYKDCLAAPISVASATWLRFAARARAICSGLVGAAGRRADADAGRRA
jgi:hypothetical protein